MNIKKSPLVAGLLTLNAIFGAMTGKAEASSYSITEEDRQAIFNQKEMAAVPVADGNAIISVRTGWSHTETIVDVENKTFTEQEWTAPFIVHSGDRSSGFTKAFSNAPELGNIGTVAVNEDNGRMYAFANVQTNEFYEFSFGNVTATEPLKILTQLTPSVTKLGFHSENDENSNKRDTNVARAIAWKDPNEGEFILTYATEGQKKTIIWHRNGVVNRRDNFAGIEPVDVLKGENVIYYGNVTNNQLVSISKANPEAGETAVSLLSDNVGVGVVGDTLYQAKSDGIYNGGVKQTMWNGENGWRPAGGISHMIGVKDTEGSKLVIAYNANATSVEYKDIQLDNEVRVLAVQGASKVEVRKDGIYALIQNQMQRVHD